MEGGGTTEQDKGGKDAPPPLPSLPLPQIRRVASADSSESRPLKTGW